METSTEKVAAVAAAFDAAREAVKKNAPETDTRNHALAAIAKAERTSVRAIFAESR